MIISIISLISLLFWLLAIPFCIGIIPLSFTVAPKKNPGVILLAGYLVMWAVFEVVAVPAVLWIQYDNFLVVLRIFTVLAILLAALGIILWYLAQKRTESVEKKTVWFRLSDIDWRGLDIETKIAWLLFFLLLGFQLYMALTYSSFDGDDAFYVVHSLMAQQSGAMYRNLPYTGISSSLDVRHAMAVFPMWIAFVAVQADLHATIVSHVVMPLVLIPLTYLIFYEIGKALFPSGRQKIPFFLILMAMFQMFGNVSIYTNETFFLTRTWQGKSVMGNFVAPMTVLLLLWIYGRKQDKKGKSAGLWALLVCLNLTAGASSSLAVFLITILLAAAALCLAVAERDWKILLKLGLSCIPNAVYVLLYLALLH
ncbi:MAG: DUF6077 domain-containing protein [Muribaculaceae bacterium]|nr:DUF6077 domain-containing protein [Muribaculaceae bacterium]